MKLSTTKSIVKAKNIVFLADKITDLQSTLSKEDFNYFKKYWKDEDMQYIKNTTGYTFVVKTIKKDLNSIRKAAFSTHDTLKKHYKEVSISGTNKYNRQKDVDLHN